MPEISRFYGIIISMHYNEHNPPHFHAHYGDESVVVGIRSLSVLEGKMSPRTLGLIIEWAALHKEELVEDWNLAKENQAPKKIAPLK